MSRSFGEYLKRKRAEYGEKFDASDLAPQFIPYYESGERIEVVSSWGTVRAHRHHHWLAPRFSSHVPSLGAWILRCVAG